MKIIFEIKKTITVTVLLITCFFACNKLEKTQQEQKIIVKGHIKFTDADNRFRITLNKRNDNNRLEIVKEIKLDSVNNYSFELETKKPEFYTLIYNRESGEFYADDENLEINFRGIDTAKIKTPAYVHINGGEKNNVLNALHWARYQWLQDFVAIGRSQYKSSLTDSKEWKEDVDKSWDVLNKSKERDVKNMFNMYKDYPTVVRVIQSSLSWKHQDLIELYERLIAKFPNAAHIKKAKKILLEKIKNIAKTNIGTVAPDFTFPNINGKEVSLSSFKGKYVLIDFWASWCGPCRKESPNVQKQYQLYKDKNFEVVSVSLDEEEDAWRKAIKEDKLNGTLLLAKDSKKIKKDYAFSTVPYMVLLDKEGKVIALNLKGEALQEKLKTIF